MKNERMSRDTRKYMAGLLRWIARLFETAETDADLKEAVRIMDAVYAGEMPKFRK